MKKAEFTLPSQNDAHFLQQLCGALWAYSEALYFRVHDIPKSIHGPYELDKKETDAFLLIRDYSEIKGIGYLESQANTNAFFANSDALSKRVTDQCGFL